MGIAAILTQQQLRPIPLMLSASRAPQSGSTEIDDKVQGLVSIQNDQLDDLILLRSDATPTYAFCRS